MAQSPKSISASDVRFRGDIPETYDRYLGPLLFEPYAADLAARVAKLEPGTVLEIAAGTGILTRQLLAALPKSSRLTATDLNEPMLDVARRKIGVDSRVTWRQADALDLPFAPETFDAVLSVRCDVLPRQGEGPPGISAGAATGRPALHQSLGVTR